MRKLVACLVALAAAGVANAAPINIPYDGNNIIYWGPSSSGNQSYGQVFTVDPGDALLASFTLTVRSDGTNFPFVAQIYAWNGTATVGPALFTSSSLTTTNVFTPYTFTPGIPVTPGSQYIALVTNQPGGVGLGGSGLGVMAGNNTTNYPGGAFLYSFPNGNPQVGPWNTWVIQDAAFSATFTSVPEPVSLVVFGSLVVGGIVAVRRRMAKAAA